MWRYGYEQIAEASDSLGEGCYGSGRAYQSQQIAGRVKMLYPFLVGIDNDDVLTLA